MATVLFKDTTHQVADLITDIRRGEIALPDLQRPYVWQPAKARELFDSMYKGFPVGYLLFWETGIEPGARQIGEGAKPEAARRLIVDGQQRLTSLFAVMTGTPVVREDYRTTRVRLAFRPSDDTFAVTDAAIERDPEYLPDISVLWDTATGRRKVIRDFLARLNDKRPLTEAEEDRIQDALDRLHDLESYPFKGVVLGRHRRGAGRGDLRPYQQRRREARPGRLHPDAHLRVLGGRTPRPGRVLPPVADSRSPRCVTLQLVHQAQAARCACGRRRRPGLRRAQAGLRDPARTGRLGKAVPRAARGTLRTAPARQSWRTVEGHPLADYLSTGWRAPRKAWLVRGSNVSGHNLVRRMWLEEGFVSLAGAHLPPLEEADPTKSALRRFVEEGYEGAASYNQKQGLVDELHAFLTQIRVGDTVATIGDGRLHVGQITGEAVQSASPGGLSNLRRTVAWQAAGHAYEELPEEVRQKLSVQHDVVDLTGVLDALDGLTGQAEGTDPAETGDTGERPA
ncbi:hypothetical protein SHIRM173S_00848 [Streptomyces hirsutus]